MLKNDVPAEARIRQTVELREGVFRRCISVNEKQFVADIEGVRVSRDQSPFNQWHLLSLRGRKPVPRSAQLGSVGMVDLFSGCGGFSLGAAQALETLGFKALHQMAVDLDKDALEVFKANLGPREIICNSVTSLVNFQLWSQEGSLRFAGTPRLSGQLQKLKGAVDLVIGGPPCQGHSGFNNLTRGDDARNKLYYTVAAAGVAVGANMIVIENVTRIVKDKGQVVAKTREVLENAGYYVREIVCSASDYGVAQSRERHFLVASRYAVPPVAEVKDGLAGGCPGAYEAIRDLENAPSNGLFDSASVLTAENKARIDFLFDNNLYELPNHVRPDCHKDGHSYPSVYGRLRPDKPANTITTGFMSPGRGRYVHPTRRRCLTPHEAARLQGFPDNFSFDCPRVKQASFTFLSKVIGDAVPPPLGFVPVFAALLTHPAVTKSYQGKVALTSPQAQAA